MAASRELFRSLGRCILSSAVGALVLVVGGVALARDPAPEPPPAPAGRRPSEEAASRAAASAVPPAAVLNALDTIVATWDAQGPAPITNGQTQNLTNDAVDGAVHALVADPGDANILYLGAVNGGVWKTTNGTSASPTWTPLTDLEQSLSIGALEMDPGNSAILLAGTGRFSSFGGDPPFQVAGGDLAGLLYTTDSGSTWTAITDPLLVGQHISAVAARGATLLAGANDFFGGGGGGLFRSPDTGGSWTAITGGAGTGLPFGAVDDMAGDPSDTTRLYVALQNQGIYVSGDTGATWTQVSNNDATLDAAMLGSSNTRIAVAGDARVFVLVTSGSTASYIGYSDDQGATWTQMDIPGTAETALKGRDELHGLVVDPSDSNIVYVSGISQRAPFPNSIGATTFNAFIFRGDASRARGLTGTVSSQWDHMTHATGNALMPNGGTAGTTAPHADSREMVFDANGNLIEGSDGGITRRTSPDDNTGDWSEINGNLQVNELHSIAYDSNFDVLIAGTQDTGAVEQTAAGSPTWNTVRGGDGGKVAIDDATAGTSVRYLSSQYLGSFIRRTCNPGCANVSPALSGGVPALVTGSSGNVPFYTPIELNASDPTRILIGAFNDVYESLDQGNTVSAVPDGGVSVGANNDAAMVYGHANNAELIYVGAGSQVFVRTTAGGTLTPTAAAFPGGTVTGIAVDPADENVIFVTDNDSVFTSSDGGATTWTDISGDINEDGATTFRSIAYIEDGTTDKLVVGTNRGVLMSVEGSFGFWFEVGDNLPNAPVWDLEYDQNDDVLAAGTLGRGAWTLADASQVNAPPVALCQDFRAEADATCKANVAPSDVDDGSFDPDGNAITLALVPPGPYMLGITPVELVATDPSNATGTCGADVEVAVSTPVPPTAAADTYVRRSDDNTNEGGSTFLSVGDSMNVSFLIFNQNGANSFDPNNNLKCVPFTARLRFTVLRSEKVSPSGSRLCIHRMTSSWLEGNGFVANSVGPAFRGTGAGATFSCASDGNIANVRKECIVPWDLRPNTLSKPWVATPTDCRQFATGQTGVVDFDVTADVAAFLAGTPNLGWAFRKDSTDNARVFFGSSESVSPPQLIIDLL